MSQSSLSPEQLVSDLVAGTGVPDRLFQLSLLKPDFLFPHEAEFSGVVCATLLGGDRSAYLMAAILAGKLQSDQVLEALITALSMADRAETIGSSLAAFRAAVPGIEARQIGKVVHQWRQSYNRSSGDECQKHKAAGVALGGLLGHHPGLVTELPDIVSELIRDRFEVVVHRGLEAATRHARTFAGQREWVQGLLTPEKFAHSESIRKAATAFLSASA